MRATQCEKVVNYMRLHGSITPLDAMLDLGIFRLGARIWDIKNKMGLKVVTKTVAVQNRFGQTCYVASYSLEEAA